MISPEILKRAAVAGAVGTTVLGAAVWMSGPSDDPDCPVEASVEVEMNERPTIETRRVPRPTVRRAPPPDETPAVEEIRGGEEESEAAVRARRAAIERAVERLTRLKRVRDASRADTIRQLERQIDRAIRKAAKRSERE